MAAVFWGKVGGGGGRGGGGGAAKSVRSKEKYTSSADEHSVICQIYVVHKNYLNLKSLGVRKLYLTY